MHKGAIAGIISGVIAALVIIITVIACSAYHVPPNTVALFRHKWTQALTKTPALPGFYMKPPMNEMIIFPTTLIEHSFYGPEYNVNTRTKDGLELALNVQVYTQIDKDYVYDIYLKHGDNYKENIRSLIKSAIRMEGNEYEASRYQEEFVNIAKNIEKAVQESVMLEHFEVSRICITSYDLPDEYEDVLLQIAIADQDLKIATSKQETEIVALNNIKTKAEEEAKINKEYQEGLIDNNALEEEYMYSSKLLKLAADARQVGGLISKGDGDGSMCKENNGSCFSSPKNYFQAITYNEIYQQSLPVQYMEGVIFN